MTLPPFSEGHRRYFVDEETGRLFFRDGWGESDGALIEELTPREWYTRAAAELACGWPAMTHPHSEDICPCGCVFPTQVDPESHKRNGRYFYHPESDCLFATWDGSEPDDPLVEELTEDEYNARQAQLLDDEVFS